MHWRCFSDGFPGSKLIIVKMYAVGALSTWRALQTAIGISLRPSSVVASFNVISVLTKRLYILFCNLYVNRDKASDDTKGGSLH